jgi:hypothetical protein
VSRTTSQRIARLREDLAAARRERDHARERAAHYRAAWYRLARLLARHSKAAR